MLIVNNMNSDLLQSFINERPETTIIDHFNHISSKVGQLPAG